VGSTSQSLPVSLTTRNIGGRTWVLLKADITKPLTSGGFFPDGVNGTIKSTYGDLTGKQVNVYTVIVAPEDQPYIDSFKPFEECTGAKVNYGPISHKGLHKVAATSTSLKLGLQIGLVANNSGVQKAAKSASNPSSSSYGKYLSLSNLASGG